MASFFAQMMSTSRALHVSVAVIAALGLAYAAPQPSATLAGVVVSADPQPRPIRGAVVTLTGPELPGNLSVVTDDRGTYTFVNLRPGRYTVTASKPAYLTSALGARAPGRPGTPLTLGAGARVTDVSLTLVRGAVLSGTIRDATGAPAANVSITIAPAAAVHAPSTFASPPEGPLLTDDEGMYRAYGLAPADYVIAASPQRSGRESVSRLPVGAIDAILRGLKDGSSGRAVGAAPPVARPQSVTFAPVYYPGTPIAAEALPVRVAAGETREGLDFTVDLVPTVEVQGRIVMADGSAIPAVQLTLTPIGPSLPRSMLGIAPRQSPDGSFAFPNVTPGRYVLLARESLGRGVVTSAAGGALWAMAGVNVTGGDLSGLTLVLRRTLTFAGRIAFSGAAPPPAGAVSKIRVGLVRVEGSLADGAVGGAQPPGLPVPSFATVGADASFVVPGVLPGLYIPSASIPGAPQWRLRSAIVDGRDLLDVPLDLGPSAGDVSGVVLTFSDWRSELAGALQDATGQPAPGHTVIVFPADRALWRSGRRLQSARPASDGHFSFADLPAGEYRLAALTDIPSDDWRRAAFLEQAVGASVQVTLDDGANVIQNLRVR